MGKKSLRKKEKPNMHNRTKRVKKGGKKHIRKQVRLLFSKKKTGPGTNVTIRVFAKPSVSKNMLGFDALSNLVDYYTQNINEILSLIKSGDKAYPKKEEVVDIYVGDGDENDGSNKPPIRKQARLLFSKYMTNPEINTNIRIFAKPSMPTSTIDIGGITKLMNYYIQNTEEQFAIFKYGDNAFPKRERVVDIYLGKGDAPVNESSKKTDK
jgi:hypothetical protein